jgi:predicted exporter
MERRKWLIVAVWAAAVGLASLYIARSLHIDSDLRLFLPESETPEERILLEELKDGPATRVLLVALSGLPPDQLAAASDRVAERLRLDALFARVENGILQSDLKLQELVLRYRYLLSPRAGGCACDAESLRRELEARLLELGSPAGVIAQDLLLRDPSGELEAILDSWLPAVEPRLSNGVWFSADGQEALLLLQTVAAGFDADRQRVAIEAVQRAVQEADPAGALQLSMTGPGAFTVLLEQSVRKDVALLGALAGLGSVVFLLLVLRSLRHVCLGVLTLATTGLAAMLGVTLAYPSVHGITLAFGVTLLGVAMDYPVHLMLHIEKHTAPAETSRDVWPTLRLSIVTTSIAYIALAVTGFTGLAQLGVFTVCGLIATGLLLRFGLPRLVVNELARPPPRWVEQVDRLPRFTALPAITLAMAAAVLLWSPRPLWNNELSGLTPVPQSLQDLDVRLRSELGAPDLRYVLAIRATNEETALQRDESLRTELDYLVSDHIIGSYESPSRLLPSMRKQRETQQRLPEPDQLRDDLDRALLGGPFRDDVFAEFLLDVEASRSLKPLTPADLKVTPLADRLAPVLLNRGDEAIALVTLTDVKDPARLAAWAEAAGSDVLLLDLKETAEGLVERYRNDALLALGFALLIIVIVMLAHLSWRAVLAVVLPVLATLTATIAIFNLAGVTLTLFHIVSMLLVGGLSFDYGLFFNRSEATSGHRLRTRYSVMVCWVSTAGAFALLMLSVMPVLRAIGSTVVLGVSLGFGLALLARGIDSGDNPLHEH